MKIDALTIVRGRQTHLLNQARGWSESEPKPDRWIIVGMDQDVSPPGNDAGIPVVTDRVDGDGNTLPLSRARNRAASLSKADVLLFMDVDCIASPRMLSAFSDALRKEDRLWMGSPRYLPPGGSDGAWTMHELQRLAIAHPIQPKLFDGQRMPSTQYEKFWSLCFALRADTFDRIGGFHESFSGYGAEDTDFAFAARHIGVPFGFVSAIAYHQHHAVCKPPLNHFDAIVCNAIQFHRRWNVWPMVSWLNAFAERGLIRFDPAIDRLEVLVHPSEQEIEAVTVLTPAGF